MGNSRGRSRRALQRGESRAIVTPQLASAATQVTPEAPTDPPYGWGWLDTHGAFVCREAPGLQHPDAVAALDPWPSSDQALAVVPRVWHRTAKSHCMLGW